MENMKFSVIIVTYAREKEYFECIESLKKQQIQYPFETIVVFNGDTSYFKKSFESYPKFIYLTSEKTTPAQARNLALKKASGEFIFFMDDDCLVPDNYFEKLIFSDEWDVLGGPDQTPPSSSFLEVSIGDALSSPLCMGPTYFRHTITENYLKNATERELILCNLWIRSEILKKNGLEFNDVLFRNEENFLIKQMQSLTLSIHYDPHLFIFHRRRSTLRSFIRSVFKSGEYRVKSFLMLPSKKEVIYLVPIILAPIYHITIIFIPKLAIILFLGYLTTSAFYLAKKHGPIRSLSSIIHVIIIISYTLGTYFALASTLHKRLINKK